MHLHAYTHTHTHTRARAHTHMHTHTHTHTHTHGKPAHIEAVVCLGAAVWSIWGGVLGCGFLQIQPFINRRRNAGS